jgi:uncharacterized membrane protein YtjA (UPF0391 family)
MRMFLVIVMIAGIRIFGDLARSTSGDRGPLLVNLKGRSVMGMFLVIVMVAGIRVFGDLARSASGYGWPLRI